MAATYNLGTAHGSVQIDADTSGIAAAIAALNQLNQQSGNTGNNLGNLGNQGKAAAGGLGVAAATLASMATRMAVSGVAIAGVIGIAQQLSGVLGLLPAIAVAGGLAMGTLKVGMQGFGDAMANAGDPEKFAESLSTLAPQAREAAIALRDLRPAWQELQQGVQNQLFSETGSRISQLASMYLPMLGSAMTTTAMHMNTAFHDVIDILMETRTQADMQAILDASAASVGNIVSALPPLVSAFINLAAVAAPILQQITSGAAGATTRFSEFVARARETGQLQAWIQGGLQAFRDLWTIISLLTGTITNLVAALGGPATLLGVLMMVAQALNTTSQFIRDNIAWIGPLVTILGAAALAYRVWMLASAAWAAATVAYNAVVNASLWATIGTQSMAALRWVGNFLMMTASGAAWVASQIVQFAVASAQWIAMAAMATGRAIVVGAAWLLTAGASAAVAVAQTIAAAVTILAQWLLMGVQALARAAMMAAAWFIALGPIGWAIAALIAVVAFVVVFWDDIVAYFRAGAQKVSEWMSQAWQWVVGRWDAIKAAFSQAGQAISNAVSQAVNWLQNTWNQGMNFLASLPGRILGIFSAAGSWLINAGRNILIGLVNGINGMLGTVWSAASNIGTNIRNVFSGAASWLYNAGLDLLRGLWNGIKAMGSWVYNQVMSWARSLLDGVKSFFGIGSPSKVFMNYGEWLMEGMGIGIERSEAAAVDAAQVAANSILDTMTGILDTGEVEAIIGNSLSDASLAALMGGAPVAAGSAATAAATGAGGLTTTAAPALAGTTAAGAGPNVNIELNTYNPIAEKASDNEARSIRAAAAVGAF